MLAVGIVAAAVVMMVAFYLLRGYRQRRLRELRGEAATPRVANDRAFNRLALARREADLLATQGGDVERARQLIDLATRSLEARDADRAYDLAQAAHETLVRARREPLHPQRPAPEAGPPVAAAAPAGPAPPVPGETERVAAATKNRAEAQFQLRLFEEDLVAAGKRAPDAPPNAEARTLYVEAHAAFERADYAEAFRLSLRGRRRVGGNVESLGRPVPATGQGDPKGTVTNPIESAEEVASRERCPACGYPTVAGDAFCRGCGAARTPAQCPSCGAPRTPQDTFCGKCGRRYD